MKAVLIAVCAAVALSGCAGGYGYDGYGGGGYDAYYDDFYGPYYHGYWGNDGVFMYRMHRHDAYVRDSGGHFRRGPGQGFHGIHSQGGGGHHHH